MSLKRKAIDLAAADAKKPKANASITSFFSAPKNSAAVSTATSKTTTAASAAAAGGDKPDAANGATVTTAVAAPKFDKAKWVEKLSDEQKELLRLEIDTLDESWLAHLKDEVTSKSFLDLKRFLMKEEESKQMVFPPAKDVYSWSRHTPLNTVKAVIIGQDPYHNVNQAHGLCFSVRAPTPAPPSLVNIYKAIKRDYPDFTPPPNRSGLLTPWADRGVLLLNTCLTVRAHQANSHANKGWERFTGKVLEIVAAKRTRGVVFLAWGGPAKKRCAGLAPKARHCFLESVHPSPLSAERGFFDCQHFKKTNAWLKERYGEDGEIDWSLDVDPAKAGV